jgi:hypothetical protein
MVSTANIFSLGCNGIFKHMLPLGCNGIFSEHPSTRWPATFAFPLVKYKQQQTDLF